MVNGIGVIFLLVERDSHSLEVLLMEVIQCVLLNKMVDWLIILCLKVTR